MINEFFCNLYCRKLVVGPINKLIKIEVFSSLIPFVWRQEAYLELTKSRTTRMCGELSLSVDVGGDE